MSDNTIFVTGATGNQGGAVTAALLESGWRVRAQTRTPSSPAARKLAAAGAQVVTELDLTGVHGVFSMQPSSLGSEPLAPEHELRLGRTIADAALAAGVHLVYSSVAGAERSAGIGPFESKLRIEEHIRAIGVPYTIVRPASFMENYLNPAFGVQTGTLTTAFRPDLAEQLIALADLAAVVAQAFGNPSEYLGRTIPLAGDELTPPQLAAALTSAAGREIPYVPAPIEALPADFAAVVGFLNTRGYGVDIPKTREVYPALTDFDTWLKDHRTELSALLS